ncbi:hypothetical protein Tco_0641339 [Tanacetum coccineum]
MEILLEPTSNKLMVERFDTSVGNPVKEILLKLNLPDHRSILTDSKMEVKVTGVMPSDVDGPVVVDENVMQKPRKRVVCPVVANYVRNTDVEVVKISHEALQSPKQST